MTTTWREDLRDMSWDELASFLWYTLVFFMMFFGFLGGALLLGAHSLLHPSGETLNMISYMVAFLVLLFALGQARYAVYRNRIEYENIKKFLSTLKGLKLLESGFEIIPFKWIDYECSVARRYIKIGQDANARYFDFDPFEKDPIGYFEDAVSFVRSLSREKE